MTRFFFQRANALPETALTMSVVLLATLGIFELILVGYNQARIDGAAFVAAHAASMQSDQSDQQQQGQQRALGVFPGLNKSEVNVESAQAGTVQAPAQILASTLLLGTGVLFRGGIGANLRSHVVEPNVSSLNGASTSSVATSAVLKNCLSVSTPGACPLHLASFQPSQADPLAEYECHLTWYQQLTNGTNGTTVGYYAWPLNYQPTTSWSINWPAQRARDWFIAPDNSLGSQVAPIYISTAPTARTCRRTAPGRGGRTDEARARIPARPNDPVLGRRLGHGSGRNDVPLELHRYHPLAHPGSKRRRHRRDRGPGGRCRSK
jgi:Flp pilus assembly protein TadG